jgi:hypothetical protein
MRAARGEPPLISKKSSDFADFSVYNESLRDSKCWRRQRRVSNIPAGDISDRNCW